VNDEDTFASYNASFGGNWTTHHICLEKINRKENKSIIFYLIELEEITFMSGFRSFSFIEHIYLALSKSMCI